jgi:NRDE-2, necessary for RNA interference
MFQSDIAMRLCSFLRQCGWTEKSVSLSQALLELCFKRPDDLSLSFVWLKALWESHVPRIGEVNCNSGAQITERQPIRAVHGIDGISLNLFFIFFRKNFANRTQFISTFL